MNLRRTRRRGFAAALAGTPEPRMRTRRERKAWREGWRVWHEETLLYACNPDDGGDDGIDSWGAWAIYQPSPSGPLSDYERACADACANLARTLLGSPEGYGEALTDGLAAGIEHGPIAVGDIARCECGHLTDERMGYPPDAKAARETPGPWHTPIRCVMYRPDAPPVTTSAEGTGLVYRIVGDRL